MDQAWLRVALSPSVRFWHMACQPCRNPGTECAGAKSHQSPFKHLCLSIYSRYENRQRSDTGNGRHSMRVEDAVANPTVCQRAFGLVYLSFWNLAAVKLSVLSSVPSDGSIVSFLEYLGSHLT